MKTIYPSARFWMSCVCAFAAAHTFQAASVASTTSINLSGSGDSTAPVLSRDGRYLAFLSTANNLATNGHNPLVVDLYVRDLKAAQTVLISRNQDGSSGGNGNSTLGSISDNGHWIVFASEASDLVARDTNGVSDVFVRDLQAQQTKLVSVNQSGSGGGNGASGAPVLSADGRFVLFESAASDLVAGDSNQIPDLFIRDLDQGTTRLVSGGAMPTIAGSGNSDSAVMTPDAQWVAFVRTAPNLISGQTNRWAEAFLYGASADQTTWISLTPQLTLDRIRLATAPALSDDGQVIVFKEVAEKAGRVYLIHEDRGGTTSVLATNLESIYPGVVDWSGPVVSADGRWVAYQERVNNNSQVRLWDALTDTNILVSVNAGGTGPGSGSSTSPLISADGRFVAFLSNATNLVDTLSPNSFQLYVRDVVNSRTRLVSVDFTQKASFAGDVGFASMSADGQVVAFQALGYNGGYDVFVWYADTGTVQLGSQPLIDSSTLRISAVADLKARQAVFTWATVPGIFYRVQSTERLNEPTWTDVDGPLQATAIAMSYSCSLSAAQQGYYRVLAQQ